MSNSNSCTIITHSCLQSGQNDAKQQPEAKADAGAKATVEANAADRIREIAAFKAARASLDTEATIEAVSAPPPLASSHDQKSKAVAVSSYHLPSVPKSSLPSLIHPCDEPGASGSVLKIEYQGKPVLFEAKRRANSRRSILSRAAGGDVHARA